MQRQSVATSISSLYIQHYDYDAKTILWKLLSMIIGRPFFSAGPVASAEEKSRGNEDSEEEEERQSKPYYRLPPILK